MSACKVIAIFTNGKHFARYITCNQAEITWARARTGASIFDYPTWRDVSWVTIGCITAAGVSIGATVYLYLQRPMEKRSLCEAQPKYKQVLTSA